MASSSSGAHPAARQRQRQHLGCLRSSTQGETLVHARALPSRSLASRSPSPLQRLPLTLPASPTCPRSDILTPLPAFGIPFEIDDNKGPLLDNPIRSTEQLKQLHAIDLQQLSFVGESLGLIRQEVAGRAAVLGFVGCPWTLATYVVEGASSSIYKNIKTMMFNGEAGRAQGERGRGEDAAAALRTMA